MVRKKESQEDHGSFAKLIIKNYMMDHETRNADKKVSFYIINNCLEL